MWLSLTHERPGWQVLEQVIPARASLLHRVREEMELVRNVDELMSMAMTVHWLTLKKTRGVVRVVIEW